MLLLVLILVLLAFGLLVVALLSGSVLWAWVSVGVSVAAAAVLLVDWLQRRNAVKAGAVAAGSNSAAPACPTSSRSPRFCLSFPRPAMPEQGGRPSTVPLRASPTTGSTG